MNKAISVPVLFHFSQISIQGDKISKSAVLRVCFLT